MEFIHVSRNDFCYIPPPKLKIPFVPKDPTTLVFPHTNSVSDLSGIYLPSSSWLAMTRAFSAEVLQRSDRSRRRTYETESDDRLEDHVEPSPKRAKRGKYVSKAW